MSEKVFIIGRIQELYPPEYVLVLIILIFINKMNYIFRLP